MKYFNVMYKSPESRFSPSFMMYAENEEIVKDYCNNKLPKAKCSITPCSISEMETEKRKGKLIIEIKGKDKENVITVLDVIKVEDEKEKYQVYFEVNGLNGYTEFEVHYSTTKFASIYGLSDETSVHIEWCIGNTYGSRIIDYKKFMGFNDRLKQAFWNCMNYDVELHDDIISRKPLKEISNPFLNKIILNCCNSENCMWFVEYDDCELEEYIKAGNDLEALEQEVATLGLDEYIQFGEDDCEITVYGGVAYAYLF